MYQVTFLPIVAAALANVIVGMIWYNPYVFGGAWMRLSGMTPEQVERGRRRMPIHALAGFLASILIAYVMSYFGVAWGVFDGVGALQLAFWCWIGFSAPVLLNSVIWEQRPFRLYLINAIYWLVAFMVMALALLYVPMLFPVAQASM